MGLLAVFSDSHGNSLLLKRAVATARRLGADYLLHLGDNYADMDAVSVGKEVVLRVPGLWGAEYKNPFIENQLSFSLCGWEVMLIHDIQTLKPSVKQPNLILYGHSHHYNISFTEGVVLFNPGHLKKELDRGAHPSFGMIMLEEGQLTAKILTPDGDKLYKKKVCQSDLRLCANYRKNP